MREYLVVGGGPGGLQLGYFLHRAGRDYAILEAGESAGTFFQSFPRHRRLLSINKVFTGFDDPEINLRWDWNSLLSDHPDLLFGTGCQAYFPTADEMQVYLQEFAERLSIAIEYSTRAVRIRRKDCFEVEDSRGRCHLARCLIMATGVSRPYLPPIPGIEHAEPYAEVSVDPRDFKGQRVLILGKGNSAFETADNLIPTAALIHVASPSPIRLAWKTHFVGHLRAVNNSLLDTYQLKSQNAVLDATVKSIERRGREFHVQLVYAHADGESEVLAYDRVIACTGFRFDASVFEDGSKPALTINGRFPQLTSSWASVNVPDLYFVGTLTQSLDYQKSTSAFIHGFRYNARALHRILEQRYHGNAWPSTRVAKLPEELCRAVLERVNKSSALWQQFGFLCDLLVVPAAGGMARLYEEVPVACVGEGGYADRGDDYYTITLEYGPREFVDPFNMSRVHRNDVDRARDSQFLHPVVRRFRDGRLLARHDVIEDLAAVWLEEVHRAPLLAFFQEQVG